VTVVVYFYMCMQKIISSMSLHQVQLLLVWSLSVEFRKLMQSMIVYTLQSSGDFFSKKSHKRRIYITHTAHQGLGKY